MMRKAFTLIELLVVISVVLLLMGMLMPALARARDESKTVLCLSNLRQLGIAAQMYANNNDDYYPIAYANMKVTPSTVTISEWDYIAVKNWSTGQVTVKPGILWQGETIEKIHQCPSFKGNSCTMYDVKYTGYNYNTSYIGRGGTERPARITQVRRPARCALFGDGEYSGGANKFMRSPFTSDTDPFPFRSAGTQGYRHNKKTNVAWCDGHASSQIEIYIDTEEGETNKIAQGTGFLSPDNSAYNLQ